jgi:hypothetical protein
LATNSTAAHNTSAPRWEHMSTYSLPCRGCSPGWIQNRSQERAT